MIINEKKQNGRIYVYAAVIYENKRLYWKKKLTMPILCELCVGQSKFKTQKLSAKLVLQQI